MNPRLRSDLDVPIRIGVWAVVIVPAVVALEPAALELPGSPLIGLAAVGLYLASARLALALTARAWHGALSFQIFGHGAALLLCGLGPLPTDPAGILPFVTLRLGALFLGLGAVVWVSLFRRRTPPARSPAGREGASPTEAGWPAAA